MFCSLLLIQIMYILLSLASRSIIIKLNFTSRIRFSYYKGYYVDVLRAGRDSIRSIYHGKVFVIKGVDSHILQNAILVLL